MTDVSNTAIEAAESVERNRRTWRGIVAVATVVVTIVGTSSTMTFKVSSFWHELRRANDIAESERESNRKDIELVRKNVTANSDAIRSISDEQRRRTEPVSEIRVMSKTLEELVEELRQRE